MPKRVAILQSNYIPWKGYFDIIRSVDEFIIYDEVQFTKNDWRNRNKIKAPQGLHWLTIPVQCSISQRICEALVAHQHWRKDHWLTLTQFYKKSRHFDEYKKIFEEWYLNDSETKLSKINFSFIRAINEVLGIKTKVTWSTDYRPSEGQTERLIDLCRQADATEYLTGPSAKDYLQERLFELAGIELLWADYSDYPVYRQLYPPFEHQVSILDLIFNEGPNATRFMKKFGP